MDDLYTIIKQTTDELMMLFDGTCAGCRRHSNELRCHSWNIGDKWYAAWLCPKCLEVIEDAVLGSVQKAGEAETAN